MLPNVQVDGTLNVEGEVFIPSGSSVDFNNGIKVNGEKLTMSIPTAYHIYNGSVEATNTILTNGFSTTLYTGNGTTQSINTGIDMATQWGDDASETYGGLVWLKSRSLASDHSIYDTIRGANVSIASNITNAQVTNTDRMNSFNINGFTVGTNGFNTSSTTYASWNFQTTHRTSGVTNHGKPYTCHYNPYTGFTIIKYEGSGITGHEIPHHLGRKLGFVTVKNLTNADYWKVGTEYGSGFLDQTGALGNSWGASAIVSQNEVVLPFLNSLTNDVNYGSQQYILYGWANSYFDESNKLIGNYEIGVYQGTGVSGNKVTTRGKPAWVMVKRLDSTGDWAIFDNARLSPNGFLLANSSITESGDIGNFVQFDEDGLNIRQGSLTNTSGGQYLYMVVYDNDSGSGKSKYPKATDTTNLSINALVPYANGIDVNGSKVSIEYKNETITGLTLTQGKNYVYSKNDGTYGVSKYEPMYGSLRDRVIAGENTDYFDLKTMKWYSTTGGGELVTNGTFDVDLMGWALSQTGTTTAITWNSGTMKVTSQSGYQGSGYQSISLTVGKRYKLKGTATLLSGTTSAYVNFGSTTIGVEYGTYAVDGSFEIDFIAKASSYYMQLGCANGRIYTFDNISVFEAEPTIDAEITPRTYLDCVVYADQNGQVSYVEELPKTTYFDEVKANEFKGKNALIAYALVDMTTTPPTIKSSFNVSGCIRVSSGVGNLYLSTPTDTSSVSAICGSSAGGTVTAVSKSMITFATGTTNYALTNVYVFGGQQ